jgi:hypothetical protein
MIACARKTRYNRRMSTAITIFHVQDQKPEAIERALEKIFASEGRAPATRVEGTYSAVLERVTSPELDAPYRYLLLRTRPTNWTPLLELGLRAEGLDIELSRALDGATVIALFQFGEIISGYRVVRQGGEVDRYLSEPTAFEEEGSAAEEPLASVTELTTEEIEATRGRPERFADLLPDGTSAADFMRVVLRPGWWEEHDKGDQPAANTTDDASEAELVDEVDRLRCIGLALELWSADAYPLAGDLEDIPNSTTGPAIALAWE